MGNETNKQKNKTTLVTYIQHAPLKFDALQQVGRRGVMSDQETSLY